MHPILKHRCYSSLDMSRIPAKLRLVTGTYVLQTTHIKYYRNESDPTCLLCGATENITLGYMTKTLNQIIIFFSSTKIRICFSATLEIRIFFLEKKHNPTPLSSALSWILRLCSSSSLESRGYVGFLSYVVYVWSPLEVWTECYTQVFCFCDKSDYVAVEWGDPQGSFLGPSLFLY
jgi:hypothetical protein